MSADPLAQRRRALFAMLTALRLPPSRPLTGPPPGYSVLPTRFPEESRGDRNLCAANGPAPRSRWIALTGYRAEISTVRRLRAAGFSGQLTKPIDYDVIVGTLDEFLANRSVPIDPSQRQSS